MVNLKFAFLKLSKKLAFSLISIFQLVICFVLLYTTIATNNQMNSTLNKATASLNKDNVYRIEPLYNMDDIYNYKKKDLLKFNNYLKSNKKFVHTTAYEDHLLIGKFNNYNKYLNTQNYIKKVKGKIYYPINALKVDYNYIKTFNLKVVEGENLNVKDFSNDKHKKETINVLLGYNFKNNFKVNDIIKYYDYSDKIVKLKVKGFIDEGFYFVNRPIAPNNILSLDNYIIYPLQSFNNNYNKKDPIDEVDMNNNIIESYTVLKGENIKSTINNIEKKSSECYGKIKLVSLDEKLKEFKDMFKIEENITKVLFFIVFIMCGIGIITNTINSIQTSYKEYAIHLLSGATKKDIAVRIIYELFIIFLVGFILSNIAIKLLSLSGILEYNYICILKLSGFVLILLFIIMIIPILYLKKVSVNNLLRRE